MRPPTLADTIHILICRPRLGLLDDVHAKLRTLIQKTRRVGDARDQQGQENITELTFFFRYFS